MYDSPNYIAIDPVGYLYQRELHIGSRVSHITAGATGVQRRSRLQCRNVEIFCQSLDTDSLFFFEFVSFNVLKSPKTVANPQYLFVAQSGQSPLTSLTCLLWSEESCSTSLGKTN